MKNTQHNIELSHRQRLFLSKMIRTQVCVNEDSQGGNEAGIIRMVDLTVFTPEEKSQMVKASGLHEIAFLQEKFMGQEAIPVEFFSPYKEIAVCGHLSLAIANYLRPSEPVNLIAKGGVITLSSDKGAPCVSLKRSDPDNIEQRSPTMHFDHGQQKEICITTLEEVANAHNTDLEGRAILFAAKSPKKENAYVSRFFRDGKEDPFHLSGLVPLATALNISEATFTSSNGGEASLSLDESSDSFLLSGVCKDLSNSLGRS